MGNIVLLDELTINQIAAGEVIERPASVIKEMVENSIDAGATNLTVEIKNGGISYIRISDNGKGIARDDVELAFERHATSKIRSANDLKDVRSMGFRGEALASIASIATVELVTKTEEEPIGTKIVVEGGEILLVEDAGCSKGTSITVRNLFFNTPVRYKFLKKDFTEGGYIEDVMTRIALVHPEIAIKLINSGRTVLQTNGSGNLKDVIYSVYGKQITDEVLEVSYEYENIKVSGVIGKPAIARSNRSNQIFFVNKRYVKDKVLTAASEQAFKGLIPIGKFGFMILNLEMNPGKVDVNVHPAKLEVRFENEDIVFKAMYHAVKDTLLKANLISDRDKTKEAHEASKDAFKIQPGFAKGLGGLFRKQEGEKTEVINQNYSNDIPQVMENVERDVQNLNNEQLTNELETNKENNFKEGKDQDLENSQIPDNTEKLQELNTKENVIDKANEDEPNNLNIEISESNENVEPKTLQQKIEEEISFKEMYKKLFGKEPYGGRDVGEELQNEAKEQESFYKIDEEITDNNNVSMFEDMEEYKTIPYKFIGIAFNTYIILEIENELYIMDQHAAHERILYEKVKKNFNSGNKSHSQLLLLPDIITLTHKEMGVAKENFSMFEKAGFILEEFGENTIKLSGVPDICVDLDTKELFMETLDEINTVARTAKQEKEERFIATVACKAAVKANMKLTKEEVDSLMAELLKLPNPFSCPHGRPTVIKMSRYDIDRKFERT